MDPNGFEVADKCETPQIGTPLGYAPNGSPYNQLINGHQYLIQEMWSNVVRGCVQTGRGPGDALPMQTVNLRQFSSTVSGRPVCAGRCPGARRAGQDRRADRGRSRHHTLERRLGTADAALPDDRHGSRDRR